MLFYLLFHLPYYIRHLGDYDLEYDKWASATFGRATWHLGELDIWVRSIFWRRILKVVRKRPELVGKPSEGARKWQELASKWLEVARKWPQMARKQPGVPVNDRKWPGKDRKSGSDQELIWGAKKMNGSDQEITEVARWPEVIIKWPELVRKCEKFKKFGHWVYILFSVRVWVWCATPKSQHRRSPTEFFKINEI